MYRKILVSMAVLVLTVGASACGGTDTASTTGDLATAGSRTGSDNSEIRTETVDGVTTETRTFRNPNSPIERVVVTTRDGKRTARVYYRDGTAKDLPDNAVESALVETADKLEDVGGKIVDVSKDVGSEVGDKAEDVGDKAADVGREVGDKAEDVGDKAASGAKKAGKATVKGAKKAGSAIKDAVTP